jgi:tetratricopeptide (TPR) repeat protein
LNKREIDKIFTASRSFDELFDAFDEAVNQKIADENLYKILLANSALSNDEIKLFAKKLSEEFPDLSYPILLWCGDIFANKSWSIENINAAIECFENASRVKPDENIPILKMIALYNHDISLPFNEKIIKNVKTGLPKIENKSAVYSAIADFYSKEGKERLKRKYQRMAEKYKEG